MATRIDGTALAAKVKQTVRAEAEALARRPGLAVILVGDDPASRVYVTSKRRDCEECGFYSEEYALPAETTQGELLALVRELNGREDIDGILVQLPLPRGLDEKEVLLAIDPAKDVDCFHPFNVGKLTIGEPVFQPCTPGGVLEMLREYGIDPAGKRCVVLGRSNIVGKPMAMLLLHANGTVVMCHSKTPDLKELAASADILVSAVGKTGLVTADMVKEGAVIIDVAMNRNDAGKLCGDVCFEEAAEKASYITPVPGGVGPMTRAMLMKNTLTAAKLHQDGNSNKLPAGIPAGSFFLKGRGRLPARFGFGVFAPGGEGAVPAHGLSGGAHRPTVEHHPMAEVVGLLRRQDLAQLLLHLGRVLCAVGEAQPAGDADAVGVCHHHAGGAVHIPQNQVGRLAAHSGQAQQILHGVGHPAAVLAEQHLGAQHHVTAFRPEKAAGVDVLAHLVNVRLGKALQGGEPRVQGGGDLVHPLVGALGGQAHGEQQLIVLLILQGAEGIGVQLLQRVHNGPHVGFCRHLSHLIGKDNTNFRKKRP